MIFASDSRSLVIGWWAKGGPALLDIKSGRSLQAEDDGHQGDIWAMTLSPDGETLATGGGDGVVIFWDRRTLKKVRHLSGHPVPIWSLAFCRTAGRSPRPAMRRCAYSTSTPSERSSR